MNNQEAIEMLKSCHSWDCEDEWALDMAIEALEKQIPKKPKYSCKPQHREKIGTCPSCEHMNSSYKKCCFECGQRLDWMEEE